jgi:hypothetical protein
MQQLNARERNESNSTAVVQRNSGRIDAIEYMRQARRSNIGNPSVTATKIR